MLDIFTLLITNVPSMRENQVRVTRTLPFLSIGEYMGLNSSEVFIYYHAQRNILGRRKFLNSSYYPERLCR